MERTDHGTNQKRKIRVLLLLFYLKWVFEMEKLALWNNQILDYLIKRGEMPVRMVLTG